jgi:hypothetical protein
MIGLNESLIEAVALDWLKALGCAVLGLVTRLRQTLATAGK